MPTVVYTANTNPDAFMTDFFVGLINSVMGPDTPLTVTTAGVGGDYPLPGTSGSTPNVVTILLATTTFTLAQFQVFADTLVVKLVASRGLTAVVSRLATPTVTIGS